MQIPEWATDDVRETVRNRVGNLPCQETYKIRDKTLIDNYSTFFAEYERRGNDVIVHVFPRAGAGDIWHAGHYIPKCRRCESQRPDIQNSKVTPCEKCGHVGLVFIPGRLEVKSELEFPPNIFEILKSAVDRVWEAEVAIEPVKELNAIAIQLQGAGTAPMTATLSMLEKMCDSIDLGLSEA